MTYVFVTHDYYQLTSLTSDMQKRDFANASKKLMNYINISKKLTRDSGYMIEGIYVKRLRKLLFFPSQYNL